MPCGYREIRYRPLREADWNATIIDSDVLDFVATLRNQPDNHILKYGNGPLMQHGLIDEFHFLLTPVAVSKRHLFEDLDGAPALELVSTQQFASAVLALVYAPTPRS